MRVAMIGPFGLKPKGTMAVRALPLAKALSRRGHELTLILPPWSYPPDAGRVWQEDAVRIENVPISPRAQIPFRIISRLRAFHPDIVHVFKPKAYSGVTQWLLWQARRGASKMRLVLDQDDWEGGGGWNDLEPYSSVQKKFFAWQEQWGMRHADAVTVASRALETILWSTGVPRANVVYVPNGVNPLPPGSETRSMVRAALHLGQAPVVLLYTRFFEFQLARLAEAMSRVFAQMPGAKLLLAGKGLFGEETKFLEMAAVGGWRDRIVDVGWLETEKLRSYFAASDVAIFPFDDTLVNRCKCSVKLIDLLASGVPVVAEAVGQVREYIRHDETGILVEPQAADAFAHSVTQLLHDREKRARLGACAAASMARDFSWDKLALGVEALYRN